MRRLCHFVFLLVLACASAATRERIIAPPSPAQRAVLLKRIHDDVDPVSLDVYDAATFRGTHVALPYRLMKPERLAPGIRYPLIVVFHGSAAIGSDNVAQLGIVAKSLAADDVRRRYPAFVLFPQFPLRASGDALRDAMDLVDHVIANNAIDAQRVYAIGYSMGASAAWNALALRPNLFAAVVAIDGLPNANAFRASQATRLLVVHGDLDPSFAPALAAFHELGGERAEFWRFVNVGHDYPIELLARPDLLSWLFAVRRTLSSS